MRQDFSVDTTSAGAASHNAHLEGMSRELGLAAVAAELQLNIHELDFDAAGAVQKGAAALFLAGFGARQAETPMQARTAKAVGGVQRRASTEPRRAPRRRLADMPTSANPPVVQTVTELAPANES